jgi:hypothetical protein
VLMSPIAASGPYAMSTPAATVYTAWQSICKIIHVSLKLYRKLQFTAILIIKISVSCLLIMR